MHIPLIGSAGGILKLATLNPGQTDDFRPLWTTKGGPEGPPLSNDAVRRLAYQTVVLQPFVPPEHVRVYEPGEPSVFVIVNTPVDFETARTE